MELRQLRYLASIVRQGGVSSAAEHEHVSQPSVSKQIRLLERELGVPLLHRVGRRVVPTEAGRLLAESATRIGDELAATLSALQALRSGLQGELRLCATETLVDNLLPPALAELKRRGPGLRLVVEMLGADDAVARLLADEFDLAVLPLPLADSRLQVTPLLNEAVLLVVPKQHHWARRERIALQEALSAPDLMLSMHGRGLRGLLEQEAAQIGVPLASTLELRSQQALLRLVALGAGICFAPAGSVQAAGADVVPLQLASPLERQIGVAVRRGRSLPPAGRTLIALLQPSTDR